MLDEKRMEMPTPFDFRYQVLFWASPVELATRESQAFKVCVIPRG